MESKLIRLNEEQVEILKHLISVEIAKLELLKSNTLEQKLRMINYKKILNKL